MWLIIHIKVTDLRQRVSHAIRKRVRDHQTGYGNHSMDKIQWALTKQKHLISNQRISTPRGGNPA
ncbi:CLUMA_CG016924, isoform A [Clunio marinus]|uniref:CLUMA_CG016924, isoform A n=1 Tax=Clunio marinus TaxID=568069 RepID=A0A1J1IS93_9DIPT|nr:CLUMA_CG016924, isoform A [Clunio marinus]